MTSYQWLGYHKKHSGPLMTELKSWRNSQMEENLVEPNSEVDKAITYMKTTGPN